MDKQMVKAIFMAVLLLSASCSPVTTPANTTFQNLPSNMTIPHNNRFVWALLPVFAPAFTALVDALAAAAVGTAGVIAGAAAVEGIKGIVESSGHSGGYGGSSGGSSGGSPPSPTTNYQILEQRVQALVKPIEQTLIFRSTSYTALKLFDPCVLEGICAGASLNLFGTKLYFGLLVQKGSCPEFKDPDGDDLLTTKATLQVPPSGICNKECCMLKRNMLPGSICFEKATIREGRCMLVCSNTEELGDSVGCDKGYKCCGQHHSILL